MKLWGERMRGPLDPLAAKLNDSLSFDRRLAQEDVQGSMAWARALARAQVLTPEEADDLVAGLEKVRAEFAAGGFVFHESDEDIHTAVERRLGELLGSLAGKLHTGRSRNDQAVTDLRLWMIAEIEGTQARLKGLQGVLLERAGKDLGLVLPGYTHLRQAQPIVLAHWWLAHFWGLERDRQRLTELIRRTRIMPLGSGALAGTPFGIDRETLAGELGFESASPNSLDAVSDRDFVSEFLFDAALIAVRLSRMAETLILFSTREFGFLQLADAYSTGSSLMPQKRNPDPLELIRAKAGVLIGRLTGWLATLKSLPSAYDKDLQEDKPAAFEAADTLSLILPIMSGLLSTLSVNSDRARAAMDPEVFATDLADYLVRKGVPFREAHRTVARAVARAEEQGMSLVNMPLAEWRLIHPAFENDLFGALDLSQSVARHSSFGGTAEVALREQLDLARRALQGA
jgi:argininosuccinate lyase